ncbi:MAG: hypothetical protein ACOVQO_10855, partial [Limnohabitans sp.]
MNALTSAQGPMGHADHRAMQRWTTAAFLCLSLLLTACATAPGLGPGPASTATTSALPTASQAAPTATESPSPSAPVVAPTAANPVDPVFTLKPRSPMGLTPPV